MKTLFEPFQLKKLTIKNRVGVPAMVCFDWTGKDGKVTGKSIDHYSALARGGAGLIVTEACAVDPAGRVSDCSLGLWEDAQQDGITALVSAVHKEGTPIIVQIQHSGLVGYGGTEQPHNYLPEGLVPFTEKFGTVLTTPAPSSYSCTFPFDGLKRNGEQMTVEDIHAVQAKFVDACVRAYTAGADGVELHGCHFYLICQFLNTNINKRTDTYGQKPELFCTEIIERVRKATSEDFIIGVRLGIFEPTLADGVAHATALEAAGADFLHLSFGFLTESVMEKPQEYPFNEFIYGADVIKKHVSIPVFAVNGIDTPELAEDILEKTHVDMCFVGTGHLVNYNWANDAKDARPVGKCLRCAFCQWRAHPDKCPGKKLLSTSRVS